MIQNCEPCNDYLDNYILLACRKGQGSPNFNSGGIWKFGENVIFKISPKGLYGTNDIFHIVYAKSPE